VQSTWVTYRSQIEIGLALLAYLMLLIGSVTLLRANPEASWRYVVAVVPVLPAALVVFLFVRRLSQTDELQKRIQTEAFAFALGATALLTFTYGFLEGAGMPHLNWTFILPLIAGLWGIGTAIFTFRYR
jgi:amino acid transporter